LFSEKLEKRDFAVDLKNAFNSCDVKGKGLVPTTEVCKIFKNLGQVTKITKGKPKQNTVKPVLMATSEYRPLANKSHPRPGQI
jgi:hypothetical protein